MNTYTADFETVNNLEETGVWLWGVCEIETEDITIGNYKYSFVDFLETLTKSATFYFHNLKFDGEFILYQLQKNGFTHWGKNEEETEDRQPPRTYTTLISAYGGMWYEMKIKLKGKGKNTINAVIRDSLKLIPLKIADMPKAFGLDIQKLDMDYEKITDLHHKATSKDIDYLKNDLKIPARALKYFFSQGLTKMTIGANALEDFKKTMNNKYSYFFPEIENDEEIRQAYKGGWTYANPKLLNKKLGNGQVYDVNGLYSWAMYDNMLPYGHGIFFEGEYVEDDLYPLYIVQIRTQFELKKNHLPTIQIKKSMYFKSTDWLTDSGPHTPVLTLTMIDLQLLKEHYNLYNTEYIGGWKFKGSKEFFKEYIDKWQNVKAEAGKNGNKGMRTIAKFMLNSLYGKFGTKAYAQNKEPRYDGEMFHLVDMEEEYKKPLYIPMACFITAYARDKTIRTAQKLYKRFVYSDTDSVHIIGNEPVDIDIDAYELGAWDHEKDFTNAKYLGPKKYMMTVDGQENVTVAGMSSNMHDQVTYDNFKVGTTYFGKLRPQKVKGGIVLVETTHNIR